ncbi:MAG: GNAT family N-acetyltransferase [Propionibacteriaceae bacterium]|nr:GNAT family N-acetyltransferase [Propionibacteriaceae bacterium]
MIRLYEELGLNAHPAEHTQFVDGWVLRFAQGHTKRSNSIQMLYPSALDPLVTIAECERRYAQQGLPTIVKVIQDRDDAIDALLEQRGYEKVEPTFVMSVPIDAVRLRGVEPRLDVRVSDHVDDEWFQEYWRLSRSGRPEDPTAARAILDGVREPMATVRLVLDQETVACGQVIFERGYAGLFNIVVSEGRRGEGYGRAACEEVIRRATEHGAHTCYLQVSEGNHVAVGLYTHLGFQPVYSYWYRVGPGPVSGATGVVTGSDGFG